MKTTLIYLIINLLASPIYFIFGFVGFFSITLHGGNPNLTHLLISYAITLLPNLILFLIILIWGNKLRLNKRISLIWFIVITVGLFYFMVLNPLEFGDVWNP